MNFDESINKMLHEAYFSSPNEKATGVKRHVGLQEGESESEFSQTKNRKNDVIDLAAMVASELMLDATRQGSLPKKGELVDAVITILHNYAQKNAMAGDEFTLDDWKNYLSKIADQTGKAPVSAERIRNVLQQAMLTLKAKLGGPSIRQSAEKEPFEDPNSDKYIGPR
jgi:hypothetical protein